MVEDNKKAFENNNKQIVEMKNIIKTFYNKDVDTINEYQYGDNLEEIIKKQKEDIAKLEIIIDVEGQIVGKKYLEKIEELTKKETDKKFSKLYREGIIVINNIEVSIDKFYIKELFDNNKIFYNFICTDNRIDKKIFGTIDDKKYELKHIYKLKDSKIFYDIYLDKELLIDNKIVLNNKEQLKKFMNYLFKWKPESHNMVAETMIKEVVE